MSSVEENACSFRKLYIVQSLRLGFLVSSICRSHFTTFKILANILDQRWLKTFSYLIQHLLQSRNYCSPTTLAVFSSHYRMLRCVGITCKCRRLFSKEQITCWLLAQRVPVLSPHSLCVSAVVRLLSGYCMHGKVAVVQHTV